jgi:Arc/MetJ-type ribon-helix-helix transcriptional regulator
MTTISAWLSGRLPDEWFIEAPEVSLDKDEIVIVGRIPAPDATPVGETDNETDTHTDTHTDPQVDADAETRAAERGRIQRWREETRGARIRIAQEAERQFDRKVAWGAACGETRVLFTHLSVPVMTRLRQPERQVLDTLVEAGVARSRSDALAWSVRLVAEHEADWIQQLREALVAVQEARKAGPAA